jgi:hypothetical protein
LRLRGLCGDRERDADGSQQNSRRHHGYRVK